MSQPLYTNNTSSKYRELSNTIRYKMNNIRNNHSLSMYRYEGIPAVLEKGNLLIRECDNIADNWMNDTDYLNALTRVNNSLNEMNSALDKWNKVMYVVPLSSVCQLENINNDPLYM